jgi:hypothetical protein
MIAALTTVALASVASLCGPQPAAAVTASAPTEDATISKERPHVRLVIDTSAMFEDEREDTARWIREDGIPVLNEAGVTVDDSSKGLEIRVVVAFEERVGYAVATSVWKPGAQTPEIDRGRRVCKACRRSDTLQLITRELAWLGGWLAVQPNPAEVQPPPEREEARADQETADDNGDGSASPRGPEEAPSMALRNAGLALAVPGGVALATGIGLIVAGVRDVDESNPLLRAELNYRSPGIVVAVSGGLLGAAGVTMLAIHVVRSRTREERRVAWMPVVDGTRIGLALGGRF